MDAGAVLPGIEQQVVQALPALGIVDVSGALGHRVLAPRPAQHRRVLHPIQYLPPLRLLDHQLKQRRRIHVVHSRVFNSHPDEVLVPRPAFEVVRLAPHVAVIRPNQALVAIVKKIGRVLQTTPAASIHSHVRAA